MRSMTVTAIVLVLGAYALGAQGQRNMRWPALACAGARARRRAERRGVGTLRLLDG